MPPFAPKLTSDVGYTQAPTAPAAEPSVFSGIGDALSGALKTADKALDSFKPKAPTYQQLKDEDELNSLNAFQTGTEKAAQLRAQGFGGQATAMENQIALDFVRAGGDPTSEEAKYMVERVTGRNADQFGLSDETHAMMKITEGEDYANAVANTYNTLPLHGTTSEDRHSAALAETMSIMAARSTIAAANGKSEAQAATNKANWNTEGGGLSAFNQLINQFWNAEAGAAMLADQAGKTLDPISINNSNLRFEQFKGNILSQRPPGIDETQWSNVTAKLAGISDVYDGLINKGESIKGAHASALIQSVVNNPDISAVVKHVIINTKDFKEFGFTGADYASAFNALQNTNEPLWKIGDGNPRDLISGAQGINSGNKGKPNGTISQEALDAYKGDPKKHVETMNGISKYFRALDSKAAGKETQTVANISQKMAASVYNSTVPFAAADINDAYNTGLIGTIREVGKTDPQTAWAMARQHSEALDQMSTKSYQNANKKFGDFAKLGQDGKVRLNWATAFDKLPASGEFRAFIEDEMRAALEPYDGDLYAFTKAYRGSKQGRSDAPKFSRGVSEFMNSMDMRVFMEEGGELKEQMDSLVAINAARGRMQAEANLIANAYNTAVEAGDEFTQEVAPAAAPVPRERPVVETTAGEKSLAARLAEGVTGAIVDGVFKPAFTDQSAAELFEGVTGSVINGVFKPAFTDQSAADTASAISGTIIDGVFKPSKGPHLPFKVGSSDAVAGTLDKSGKATDTLMNTLVQIESGGNPNAVSPVGARGLYQLMPKTAAQPGFGVRPLSTGQDIDAASPAEQKRFSTDYLNAMLERYDGNLELALAAYNGGAGTVDKYLKDGKALPKETVEYVQKFKDAGAFDTDPVQPNSPVQPATAASGGLSGVEDAVQQAVTDNGLPPSQKEDFGRQLDNRAPIPLTRMGDPAPVPRKRPSESPTPGRNLPALDEGQSWLSRNVGQPLATVAVSLASQAAGAVGGPAFAFLAGDLLDAQLGGNWRSFDQTDMSPEYSTATHNAVKLAYANGKSKTTYGVWASMAVAYENQALVEQYYGGDLVAAAKDKLAKAPKADRPSFPTVQESLSWSPGGKGKVEATMTNPYINLMYTFGEAGFTKEGEGFRITDQYDNNWYRDYTRPSGNKAYTQVSTEEFEKFKGKRTLVQLFEETRKAYKDKKVSLFGLVHNSQYLFGSRDWTDDTKDESKKINMFFSGADKQTLSQEMSSTIRGHIAGE